MPVAIRMKNVLKVRAPRYQVGLNSRARERTFTENRCRKMFCWTAWERCRLLEPLPLRNIVRQTSVFLILSNSALTVVAMLIPSRIPVLSTWLNGRPSDCHLPPARLSAREGVAAQGLPLLRHRD